jgi:hypothetical protein
MRKLLIGLLVGSGAAVYLSASLMFAGAWVAPFEKQIGATILIGTVLFVGSLIGLSKLGKP